MAFASSDLDAIRAAISSGVLRVRFADGRETYFQTIDGLIKAEQRIMKALAAAQPGARPARRVAPYRNGC